MAAVVESRHSSGSAQARALGLRSHAADDRWAKYSQYNLSQLPFLASVPTNTATAVATSTPLPHDTPTLAAPARPQATPICRSWHPSPTCRFPP